MKLSRSNAIPSTTASSTERQVFVICPGGAVSGGPEVLHQLAGLLRSWEVPARIVYTPFDKPHSIPSPYVHYGVQVATFDEIAEGSIVIVPEVYEWLLTRLKNCRIYFWWLSVDNCSLAAWGKLRPILPRAWIERVALARIRKSTFAHLYQSEYARLFAEQHKLGPAFPLSDYLSSPFIAAAQSPRLGSKENVVLYNPAKGIERTEVVLAALAEQSPVPIEPLAIRDMTRDEVAAHLARAKVYIDFGNHPGKDRIPREAAASGCCVITNRRGSAANQIDVPIPPAYKFDDGDSDFARRAAKKISDVCMRFEDHAPDFDAYRRSIAAEPDRFAEQAAALFASNKAASRASGASGG